VGGRGSRRDGPYSCKTGPGAPQPRLHLHAKPPEGPCPHLQEVHADVAVGLPDAVGAVLGLRARAQGSGVNPCHTAAP
jgi:hypothetical protein